MQTNTHAKLTRAIDLLTSPNEDRAREAWEQLWEISRPYLLRYLSTWLHNPDDREDVIQDAFLRVWTFRTRFRNQGEQAWFAFIRRTAYRCMVDMRRRYVQETLSLDDVEESEIAGITDVADSLAAAMLAHELYSAADILWLGLSPQVSPQTRQVQLLAAQLYYLHEASWQEVMRLLAPSGVRVDRRTLGAWLSDTGVLRSLCYHELYYSNDRLAGSLLQLPEPYSEKQMDVLVQYIMQGLNLDGLPDGMSRDEAWLILWRYRYALPPNKILQRTDCPYQAEQMQVLLERLHQQLPFRQRMDYLLSRFEQTPGVNIPDVLHEAGLWQRLALQYCYHDDLSHVDIYERMAPAAERAGYCLTMGMLNVWLSNGRLVQKLARFYRQWKGVTDDAT
ncbi:MAG: RNA polymerase sigma factor [Chthonomonadetes bacterium]|nr:RNA polymerase sigma factor [Chthonomonadetes bacterium]